MVNQYNKQRNIIGASLVGAGALWLTAKAFRMTRKIDLRGKTVLITGGSRGLGLGLAREFVHRGSRVAICARDQDELTRAVVDIQQHGGDIETFICDVTNPLQVDQLIQQVEAALGPIDVLINNAGTIVVGPAQAMTLEDYQQAMNVNYWAAVHTTLAVLPRMQARRRGRIVNIGSIGGKMPVPHLAAYCASKFALVGFSATLRAELARDGIVVTTVNPGLMRTGSPRNASFKGDHQREYAWFALGDSAPGLSMSVRRAAAKIANAAAHGDGEVTLGWPAKVGSFLYALAPNAHIAVAELVNRSLPKSANTQKRFGHEAESPATQSSFNALGHAAERQYNQLST